MTVLKVIAIDGPSAAGKGTLARRIAAAMDYAHLDSGTLYRAVAAKLLAEGRDPADCAAAVAVARALVPAEIEELSLRGEAVAAAASVVAALQPVRDALVGFQRAFAAEPPGGKKGAVLDGRDIGTVICPEAEAKLYVIASAEVRAERRFKELTGKGIETTLETVLADVRARDERDMGRAEAPLKPAEDAVHIDTTAMDIEAAIAAALGAVRARQEART